MWICTKFGFFSVVQKLPGHYHVRARCRQDLVNLLARFREDQGLAGRRAPRIKIHRTEPADYRFRIVVTRHQWLSLAPAIFDSVTYHNFKDFIARSPEQYDKLAAYSAFHHDMERLQNGPDLKPLDWEPSRTHDAAGRPDF